jgi:pantoate kinase
MTTTAHVNDDATRQGVMDMLAQTIGGSLKSIRHPEAGRSQSRVMKMVLVLLLGFMGAFVASPALADTTGEE